MKMNAEEFRDEVWGYGSGLTTNVTEAELDIITSAWAEVERMLNSSSEDDDTSEEDAVIDSYYGDYLKA